MESGEEKPKTEISAFEAARTELFPIARCVFVTQNSCVSKKRLSPTGVHRTNTFYTLNIVYVLFSFYPIVNFKKFK